MARLNGGVWHGKRILQRASQAQLWEKLYDWGGTDYLTGYGWGWELGKFRGQKLVTSFGGQPGVQTVGALLPTEGLGAIATGLGGLTSNSHSGVSLFSARLNGWSGLRRFCDGLGGRIS